jgi:murein DD-endopeptidase MepM/ murein hydrolase activator NlpD
MPLYNPLAVMRLRSDQGVQHKVSHAGFGMVRNAGKRWHQGWDLYASVGTPAFAIADGMVVWTRDTGGDDFGLQLLMQFNSDGSPGFHSTKSTRYAFYAHLSAIFVKPNDYVKAKREIALTGISGNAHKTPKYPHLHFEIRVNPSQHLHKGGDGRIDPAEIFGPHLLANNSAQIGGVDTVHMVCRTHADQPVPVDQKNEDPFMKLLRQRVFHKP